MTLSLTISLILNLIIIISEISILSKIKNKINILKYYTFLQNFLTLIISIIFSISLIISVFFNRHIPEYIKGLRYMVTTSLIVTTFIYSIFLSKNSYNLLTKQDFISNTNIKKANLVLHYFCPLISLISFLLFERKIPLTNSIWTIYIAIPSCIYWIIYLILSSLKLWKEPYDFSLPNNNSHILEILTILIIPISFIFISYILWNIK